MKETERGIFGKMGKVDFSLARPEVKLSIVRVSSERGTSASILQK